MTVPEAPPEPPQSREGLSGCAVAEAIVFGLVLIVPGLCAIIAVNELGTGGGVGVAAAIALLVAAGGIWLIIWAVKQHRRAAPPPQN